MAKDDYVSLISKASNKYGDKLIELMDKYHRMSLKEITLEEAKEFYESMVI